MSHYNPMLSVVGLSSLPLYRRRRLSSRFRACGLDSLPVRSSTGDNTRQRVALQAQQWRHSDRNDDDTARLTMTITIRQGRRRRHSQDNAQPSTTAALYRVVADGPRTLEHEVPALMFGLVVTAIIEWTRVTRRISSLEKRERNTIIIQATTAAQLVATRGLSNVEIIGATHWDSIGDE
ncbi:hypothetical protein BDZ89DRAFT_1038519 [Hymenopellis radicata]|nr:hypothetical protein BDZ89DRAFT_1038519 [Hymenopellis radicata]